MPIVSSVQLSYFSKGFISDIFLPATHACFSAEFVRVVSNQKRQSVVHFIGEERRTSYPTPGRECWPELAFLRKVELRRSRGGQR